MGEYIDPELPLPRVDVVYFLRRGDAVKIGTTVDPRRRFRAIRHDEVLAFERGGRPLEQLRHAEFAADRLGTSEWFALSPRLRAHVSAVSHGRDAWEQYARWLAEALAAR